MKFMKPRKKLFTSCSFTLVMVTSVSCCSDTSSSNSSFDYSTEQISEYSESDIEKCNSFSYSTSLLEQQETQDTYLTALGIVRGAYENRENAWIQVMGSANYEISELTLADDWEISSAADDLENAYRDGLDVVSYSTDPDEIETALSDFFAAFDTLVDECEYATS